DDSRAQAYYAKVSRAAPEWLDALFESSWSHFRNGDDDKALGNLLTLHAPFFQGRYYPESYVLKALVLYENCRYLEARRTLREFEARYRPLHDGLAGALDLMPTAQAAVESLSRPGGVAGFPDASRDEVARVISAPELKTGLVQVAQMAQEIDSIDRRPQAFQRTALAQAAVPRLREARLDLLQSVGDRVRSRLAMERGELRELLGQGLRLDVEIAGREKELAEMPEAGSKPVAQRKSPPSVEEDEVLWPFEGEYWRDELGSYRYQLGQKCAKPRPVPARPSSRPEVQTAAQNVATDVVATPGPAMTSALAIAALAAAAVSRAPVDAKAALQPGRDPALLHPHADRIVQEKEEEQERALRRLLALGGNDSEQAEIVQRLAATLRA